MKVPRWVLPLVGLVALGWVAADLATLPVPRNGASEPPMVEGTSIALSDPPDTPQPGSKASTPSPAPRASSKAVPSSRGAMAPAAPRAQGRLVAEPPRSYRLRLVARFVHERPGLADVTLTLPLPQTDGERQEIEGAQVRPAPTRTVPDAAGNPLAEVSFAAVAPRRAVEAVLEARVRTRHLSLDLDDRLVKPLGAHPPREVAQALEPSDEAPSKHPVVQKLIAELTAVESRPLFRLLRAYDYVRKLRFVESSAERSVPELLADGQVQCSDASRVFVTLCRAAQLPARYVGGLFAFEEGERPQAPHAWAEVWLPPYGWVPCDPTMGRFDDAVRASRFGQLVGGYVSMWRGTSQAFTARVQSTGGSPAAGADHLTVTYQLIEEGAPAAALVPLPAGLAPRLPGRAAPAASAAGSGSATSAPAATTSGPGGSGAVAVGFGLRDSLAATGARLEAASRQQRDADGLLRLAAWALYTRQAGRGIAALREAIAVDPTRQQAWQMLRDAYVGLDLWTGVREVALAARTSFPHDEAWQLAIGQAAMRLGRWTEARDAFQVLLREHPRDGWLHAMHGWAAEGGGDRALATSELELGLRLGVEGSEKAFFEKKVRRLRQGAGGAGSGSRRP